MLKSIKQEDIKELWYLIFDKRNQQWKKWDAPYFPLEYITLEQYAEKFDLISTKRLGIWLNDKLIGAVSYYWEHEASLWLEFGITIYSAQYWRNGYGMECLILWVSHLFKTMPLVRVGLTTWSGNTRMMNLAEKLGFKQEARLRKCRLWQGKYYDSIRYGVLREEWVY